MSEYQYYEFRAVDRPIDRAAQKALRSISSRAQISSRRFTNHYEWGDLKGDPRKFMEQWFDLHLYLANWGARRLMMRVPKRYLSREDIRPFLGEVDWAEVWGSGDHLIIDMHREELELDHDWDEDESDRLSALAPLRADLLSGDFRMLYLLWLTAVQDGRIVDDEAEPLPGIGPLTEALRDFAAFFDIDPDLVAAAAEREMEAAPAEAERRAMLAGVPEHEKIALLLRVMDADPAVAAELGRKLRKNAPDIGAHRKVGALRKRAQEIAQARERAAAERRQAELRRAAEQVEKAKRARLQALRQRGESVWRDVETEIERRNAPGYDRAAGLLADLQALAIEDGSQEDFSRRLASIRTRHEKKAKFIARLSQFGCDRPST
jgi:hypothetical protein